MVGFLVTMAFVAAERPPHDEHGTHCVRCAVDAQHKDDDGLNSPRVDRSLDDDFLLVSYDVFVVPPVSHLPRAHIIPDVPDRPPDSLFRPPRRLCG